MEILPSLKYEDCKQCLNLMLNTHLCLKTHRFDIYYLYDELFEHHLKWHKKKYLSCRPKGYKSYFLTITAGAKPVEYDEIIRRILHYKKFKITYGYGVIELTKNKQPHAHLYIETTDYLRSERLKRLWKHSFIQVKRILKDNGIKKYCEKDKDNTELLKFCKEHAISRLQELL